jgi:pimeloyl-ACP methyl ester carboxylesterase
MSPLTSHTLDVPGACLYYEVQGSGPGPVLMLIGHPMGIEGFAFIAPLLAEHYTVVTYDPRGFARSTIEDPNQDGEPDVLADDVRRVLDAVGEGPAYVFGSSGGAVTGLALLALFPDHVTTLVAHEPPVGLLLPDPDEAVVGFHDIYDTYQTAGSSAAWQKFGAFTGMSLGPPDAQADAQPPSAAEVASNQRFFEHGLLTIGLYQPDLAALRAAASRLVVAGGVASRGEFPQRTAAALAERLGTPLMEFPGGHVGFVTDPQEFATVLQAALG